MKKKEYITIINEIGVPEKVEYESDRFIIIDYTKNKIASLQHQLAEKDKEIERLKEDCNASIKLVRETQEEIIRHQICDKIRERVKDLAYFTDDWFVISCGNIGCILNDIENEKEETMIHFSERLKLVNDTRHRVCEEIREKLKYSLNSIETILYQIEKGE